MKTTKMIFTMLITLLIVKGVNAQRDKVAVINFDTKGILLSPAEMGQMVNQELQKYDDFEVMDKYDMLHVAYKNQIVLDNCYGSKCAVEAGRKLGVQKVLTGSVIRYDEKITYSMRLVDVISERTVLNTVFEFKNLQPHLQKMTDIMLSKLLNQPYNEQEIKELQYLEEPVIANTSRLSAKGPRMGIAYITPGSRYEYLEKYDIYPILTQFGYQHEVQYLSTGNFEALFEFIGMISGMDQGIFVPTVSFLNGLRNSKNGLEFAFGPTFGLTENTEGIVKFNTNFVYAVGKTFQSGNLNIPVNLYVSPDKKDGWFVGASFGFNIANKSF